MTFSIRPAVDADILRLVELNTEAVPAVNLLSNDELGALVAASTVSIVIVDDADTSVALGFAVAFAPGIRYSSENYAWFEARGTDFLYLDRIVVAPEHRGRMLGAALYREVFAEAARRGAAEVACEVNVEPPNPGSMRFHGRLGFGEVGRQSTKGGSVVVALLAAPTAGP